MQLKALGQWGNAGKTVLIPAVHGSINDFRRYLVALLSRYEHTFQQAQPANNNNNRGVKMLEGHAGGHAEANTSLEAETMVNEGHPDVP